MPCFKSCLPGKWCINVFGVYHISVPTSWHKFCVHSQTFTVIVKLPFLRQENRFLLGPIVQFSDHPRCSQLESFFLSKHRYPKLHTVLPLRFCGITLCALKASFLFTHPKMLLALLRQESASNPLCWFWNNICTLFCRASPVPHPLFMHFIIPACEPRETPC